MGIGREAGTAERGLVAVQASGVAHGVVPSLDHRDPAVTEFQQVLGRCHATAEVRRADAGHGVVGHVHRVDQHQRDAVLRELGALPGGQFGRHQDDALPPRVRDLPGPGSAQWVVGRRADDDVDPGLGRGLGHTLGDQQIVGVDQLVEGQVDGTYRRLRAPGPRAT